MVQQQRTAHTFISTLIMDVLKELRQPAWGSELLIFMCKEQFGLKPSLSGLSIEYVLYILL